jgi:hypothetical protein
VSSLCRRYGVTAAGFYAWRRRGESAHAKQDRILSGQIAALFAAHQQRYGSPRIHHELRQAGWIASRRRVARLMRQAGLCAKDGQRFVITPAATRAAADRVAAAAGARSLVLAVQPQWSVPSNDWVAADPDFWRENPTAGSRPRSPRSR